MKVVKVMTKDVVSVEPGTTLKEVAEVLSRERISGVPVVDGSGAVVGVVSEADIVAKATGGDRRSGLLASLLDRERPVALEARTAGEAMTSPAITIAPERDMTEAAREMIAHEVNRLPVVDSGGRLVGIVTRADLVRAFTRPDEEIERELREEVMLDTLWIDPRTVEVSVRQGEVTLGGEVDTKTDARLVESLAARVPGVVSVRSELRWRRDEPRLPQSDPHVPIPPRR